MGKRFSVSIRPKNTVMKGPPQAKNHHFCYLGFTHTPPRGEGVFPDLSEMRPYPGFLNEMESYVAPRAWRKEACYPPSILPIPTSRTRLVF